MYLPSSFAETNLDKLIDLIRQHPLGLLVSSGASGLLASPIPVQYRADEGSPKLVTHMARANPHWQEMGGLNECLIVFQGLDAYVTPSWYPTKATTHKVVPTWNYETVQVRGIPKIRDDIEWLKMQVQDITDAMEHKRRFPWKVSDAPDDYIAMQLKAIVGLEIEITDIKGKWKMSQNKTPEEALGVVAGYSDPHDPHCNLALAQMVVSRIVKKT